MARVRSRRSSTDEYGHLAPHLAEFVATGPDDPRRAVLRDRLVAGYLPVVQHIARRYVGRGEPLEDLEQAGSVGLIGAVDRFDPTRGADFLSFAVPTITGSIRRHFRDHAWAVQVPRRLKEMHGAMKGVIGPLSQELGRAPRPSDIATRLDVPIEEVLEAIDAQHGYRNDSLDEQLDGDVRLSERMGEADSALDAVEYRETLAPLLDQLDDRDRTIVMLRFFGNRTQTQIAEVLGLSQMHISRLLAQILARLRAQIDGEA